MYSMIVLYAVLVFILGISSETESTPKENDETDIGTVANETTLGLSIDIWKVERGTELDVCNAIADQTGGTVEVCDLVDLPRLLESQILILTVNDVNPSMTNSVVESPEFLSNIVLSDGVSIQSISVVDTNNDTTSENCSGGSVSVGMYVHNHGDMSHGDVETVDCPEGHLENVFEISCLSGKIFVSGECSKDICEGSNIISNGLFLPYEDITTGDSVVLSCPDYMSGEVEVSCTNGEISYTGSCEEKCRGVDKSCEDADCCEGLTCVSDGSDKYCWETGWAIVWYIFIYSLIVCCCIGGCVCGFLQGK